jgi:putative hydrolase of the HAD superfamily
LLHTLKKRYNLGLVSNFAYAPGFWRVLEYFNLASFFHSIVVSGELGFRKPHPSTFREVLEALDVTAAEAVFVGDSLKADIYGAKRMGFKMVLVENVGLRKNPYAIAGELGLFPVTPHASIQVSANCLQF